MSNTYSSTAQNLSIKATSAISAVLAPRNSVCHAFPLDKQDQNPALPREVSVIKGVSDTQTAANPDYSAGDATIAPTFISHTLFTQPFGIANDELNNGARLDWLASLNAQKLAATISDAISGLLTTANYGSPIATVGSSSFAVTDFETLYAGVPTTDRCIVLDTPYFAKVKPQTWLPPGFSNVKEHTRWASAGASVTGFVADPRAIVLSYGSPIIARPGREVVSESPFILPQIGLLGTATVYFLTASRKIMGCFSVYMGGAVGDSSALKLLTSA